jgi:hypothetical protein
MRFEKSFKSYSNDQWLLSLVNFDLVTCYHNRGNEKANIGYNMNYMNVFEWSREDSSP